MIERHPRAPEIRSRDPQPGPDRALPLLMPHSGGMLSPQGRMIFLARAVRSFAFGWLSVILALYLAQRGLSAGAIGAVFTATMVEDALLTLVLSLAATRIAPARVMAFTAPLLSVGGVLLASASGRGLLLLGAVLGTLSPNGQEAGPFASLEQALLPGAVRSGSLVRMFSWYNICGFLPAAAGAAVAGACLGWSQSHRFPALGAYRVMLLAYAGAGLALTLLYARLSASVPAVPPPPAPRGRFALGLGRSRRNVFELAGLQSLDAFAGGFILQGLLVYWFELRFAPGPAALGALFFGTNLLSALSFLAAPRVAARIGLLATAVFTHLLSNLLLLAVPFMPSFGAAAVVLLARHLLSQMDVPTRQAYVMALVAPEERAAAAGLTNSLRALAQACAPAISGLAMASAASASPFLLAGGLKIVYDLSFYFRFRSVPLPGERA